MRKPRGEGRGVMRMKMAELGHAVTVAGLRARGGGVNMCTGVTSAGLGQTRALGLGGGTGCERVDDQLTC